MAPEYEKLAEHYAKKGENVIIAEMDATKNELEGLHIHGYPTMHFYPAGSADAEPIDYEGERELEDMIKFVEENKVTIKSENDT